jgi:hypothetical protein
MPGDIRLIRSPVSLLGAGLTTLSAVLFLAVFLADLFGLHTNPYLGIVFFLVLPALFVVGLLLIPLGAWVERRRRAAGKAPSEVRWPQVDLNDPGQRRTVLAVLALTMANIVIVSLAAYRGVEYMDSVEFCGQVCHSVMKPEYTAHQDAPHSRVACVACHVGPGASSFAQSKLSGTRQLLALARGTYARPIPAPVEHTRPARDTCEGCHWSEKFHGDRIRRVYEYADDEQSTESVTTLRLHVGGGSDRLGVATGIHWHMNVANRVEYVATDDQRQVIPYVRLEDRTGTVREYYAEGVTPEDVATRERRVMDCLDCHNRPSHTMAASAERAVDAAIARGEMPRTLPFARREAVKALKAPYVTEAAALEGVARSLRGFYAAGGQPASGAPQAELEKLVAAAQRIYQRNVFPEMNVRFGTYPNQIGHIDFPGCFRCHDDSHKTGDGRTITQDCETCHTIE